MARQVQPDDFYRFDLILAMDQQNLADLQAIKNELTTANGSAESEIATLALLSEEDPIYGGNDVPDPYEGGEEAFEAVLDQIESSVDAWIESWKID